MSYLIAWREWSGVILMQDDVVWTEGLADGCGREFGGWDV